MDDSLKDLVAPSDPDVWVQQEGDLWFVHVLANGIHEMEDFKMESSALSYADGQRKRLGLPMRSNS